MLVRKVAKHVPGWSMAAVSAVLLVGLGFTWSHSLAEGATNHAAAAKAAARSAATGASVEQTTQGQRAALPVGTSFDGLGQGFYGPQGGIELRASTDNSVAVGPDDIVQISGSWFAVYKKDGKPIYGPAPTNEVFQGFGGPCAERAHGDSVVRYDQLANRWLFIEPIFFPTGGARHEESGGQLPAPGQPSSPGAAEGPRTHPPAMLSAPAGEPVEGTYGMCYAVSTGSDPLGTYYRYAFARKNFPDYPRPGVWPDGYYLGTSSGDTVIQKHLCIADRAKMLKGEPATEQCIIMDGVNFLNPSDIDGQELPPPGAPNIVMADGGSQLKGVFNSDAITYWKVHVDWDNPANTKAAGPFDIHVAPYHYLCNGQLTACVPQLGVGERLDSQGDKLMQRLVYRRIGDQQSIVASQSVSTAQGGGGVRWYEFRLNNSGDPSLYQQGTYAPDPGRLYRWAPSIDMDRLGDIGVGYSFGSSTNFPGHRFAARKPDDPRGKLTFRESTLVKGEAAQMGTSRWVDYATTAMDPSDDCTFWYVGVYYKQYQAYASTRIASVRVPGCRAKQ
ncbi:MAG TPA: hypothetical protein VFW94_09695 [Candidatus Acidoferrales bacterium]|nr:hypothetical protein [Candidatus Acidoferrales bacterium]